MPLQFVISLTVLGFLTDLFIDARSIQGEDETSVCTESISWMSLPNSDRHEGFWIIPIESMRINGLDMEGPFDGAIFDA